VGSGWSGFSGRRISLSHEVIQINHWFCNKLLAFVRDVLNDGSTLLTNVAPSSLICRQWRRGCQVQSYLVRTKVMYLRKVRSSPIVQLDCYYGRQSRVMMLQALVSKRCFPSFKQIALTCYKKGHQPDLLRPFPIQSQSKHHLNTKASFQFRKTFE
jgi:hypothetical protein